MRMLRLGIIGSGARAAWIASCLRAADSNVVLSLVADPNPDNAREKLAAANVPYDQARFVDSVHELIDRADVLDGVIIATPCDLHTPLAILLAPTGLPVFLEKPVAL